MADVMRLHAIRDHAQNTVEPTREQFDLGFFRRRHYGGVRHTSPYFHDHSANTLREVVDQYADLSSGSSRSPG
jgi:cytochrome c peroxidase